MSDRRRRDGGKRRTSSTPTWRPAWRRGLPARVVEDPAAPETGAPLQIGSVIEGLMGSGPWQVGLALGDLARRWEQVVGEALVRETAPARLEAGVLSVRASNSAWAAQVGFLAEHVRANANAVLGGDAVRSVRVFVDQGDA